MTDEYASTSTNNNTDDNKSQTSRSSLRSNLKKQKTDPIRPVVIISQAFHLPEIQELASNSSQILASRTSSQDSTTTESASIKVKKKVKYVGITEPDKESDKISKIYSIESDTSQNEDINIDINTEGIKHRSTTNLIQKKSSTSRKNFVQQKLKLAASGVDLTQHLSSQIKLELYEDVPRKSNESDDVFGNIIPIEDYISNIILASLEEIITRMAEIARKAEIQREREESLVRKLIQQSVLIIQSVQEINNDSHDITARVDDFQVNNNSIYNYVFPYLTSIITFSASCVTVVLAQIENSVSTVRSLILAEIIRVKNYAKHKLDVLRQCVKDVDDQHILDNTENAITQCIENIIRNILSLMIDIYGSITAIGKSVLPLCQRFRRCVKDANTNPEDEQRNVTWMCLKQIGYEWSSEVGPFMYSILKQSVELSKVVYFLSFSLTVCVTQHVEATKYDLSLISYDVAKCVAKVEMGLDDSGRREDN